MTSHDVVVETIAATTTSTGLIVHAELDHATYPTGVKIPDAEMKALETDRILIRHDPPRVEHTLNPERSPDHEIREKQLSAHRVEVRSVWAA